MVAALNEAQRDVDQLKMNKKKLKTKISEFVGNASEGKRKTAALERCKLHLAEALEIKAAAKFELDEALKIQAAAVEVEKEKRKVLSKYLEEQKEKERIEEERLRAQRKLEAERAALTREEHLREMREQRHTKEAILDRTLVQETAPVHPRAPNIDPELEKFLEEAENIMVNNNNNGADKTDLPPNPPKASSQTSTVTAPVSPSPPTSPVEPSPATKVPKNLESSSPAENIVGKDKKMDPNSPEPVTWRKESISNEEANGREDEVEGEQTEKEISQ
ncbi:hypothetical protein TrLO_g15435 [Triparma laevis f. longispina]|uniref:Uncharacterized protein n=1 Tax=Triparma laevis f. longispina TaxID=1714387 RepID=A0A9W7EFZ8_9STRA|nr:hypothetical protein TrLO_g15435 [Triparma laevis f. longispina]